MSLIQGSGDLAGRLEHWAMQNCGRGYGEASVTSEGAWHDPRKLMMVISLKMLPVVQKVMNGLHVEALLNLGEGSSNDVQCHHHSQERCASCKMPRRSDG